MWRWAKDKHLKYFNCLNADVRWWSPPISEDPLIEQPQLAIALTATTTTQQAAQLSVMISLHNKATFF